MQITSCFLIFFLYDIRFNPNKINKYAKKMIFFRFFFCKSKNYSTFAADFG